MNFLRCVCYLLCTGTAGFLLGRLLPKKLLHPDRGLFRCFPFERDGRIYEKTGIRKWQKKVPDMSRIFPRWMPPKHLQGDYATRLPVMIRETCVAELVHMLASLAGLGCLYLWPGPGGITVTLLYILLFNLPYILIQRYNRPRLLRLQEKLNKKKDDPSCAF